MSLLEWKDEFSVGVTEFDGQHKVLIDLINKLHDAMRAGVGRQALSDILSELVDYTKTHFENEEKLFLQYSYPESPAHRREHDALTKQVLEFQKEYQAGRTSISIDVMDFLKDWLLNHIAISDKKYTQFFNEKGIR